MAKINRIYRLTIETNVTSTALVIENPLTIDFTVDRSAYAGTNSLNLQIYNLNDNHRNLLFQDTYGTVYKRVILQAGYKDMGMSTIFIGNMFNCYSYRDGVNVITKLYALDGGLDTSTSRTNTTFKEGTTIKDIVSSLMGSFPHLTKGAQNIDDFQFKRPVVLNGNSFQLIKKYTNGNAFVDMEKVNILKPTDVVTGYVPLIDETMGLLKTPERRNTSLSVELMFEPRIIVGQIIEIRSKIAPQFDGQYKVIGLKHSGTISDAVAGTCITSLELFVGTQLFGRFNNVTSL